MSKPLPWLTIDQVLAIRPLVNPELPMWSADGTSIAFVSSLGGQQEIWSMPASGGFPTRLTVEMGVVRFLGSPNARRSPDGRHIAYISEKTGAAELWLWSEDGATQRQLTRLGANINSFSWSPDSQTLALASSRYGSFDIYRVEIADGQTKRLTSDTLYEVYPVFTPDGQNIIYVRLDEHWEDHDVVIIPAAGGEGRVITRDEDLFDYHYGRTFGYPLVSPDGRTLLFRSQRSGWTNYWRVSVDGGDVTPLNQESADQSEAAWSPDGRTVAFIANTNGTLALCLVDADGRNRRTLVAPELGACSLPQWSPDGRAIAFNYQTPTSPLELRVVDVASGAVRALTSSLTGGGVAEWLVTPEKVAYPTFDGRTINAYLYKPPSVQPGQKFPGIIWVHGGPTSQYFDAYYPYAQFFAQQGYVILKPNIRGSSGYGKEFEELNDGDWGHDDLKDVVAAVDFLKTLDYIDPDNMGITGTSYGGCMSMSAVCFAPGVFKAAIPMSGYADWVAMYEEQELRHIKLLEHEFGPFETSQDIYRKCSPIFAVKQATTPTLVIHGEGKLPRSEASRDFVKAMEKEYKTVQYNVYPNEGYYVQSHAGTRQMWLDMLAWLNRYLKGM